MTKATDETVLKTISRRILEEESAFRAFLRKRVPEEHLVDDLLQQSLMRAVEREHQLKAEENSVSWFYRILRNAVTDYYRARQAESRKHEGFLREMVTAGKDKTPTLDEVRPTVCECMGRLLTTLRPAYADLITRIDLGGESPAVVAKDLGLTANNLTVRLHRACQALRAALERSCGVCTKHGCLDCTCAS